MTREEAIQELQNCKGLIQQDGQDYLDERDIPLLDMAIEALSVYDKLTCKTCADRTLCIMSAPDGQWKACKDYRPQAEPPTIPTFAESEKAYKAWTGEEMGKTGDEINEMNKEIIKDILKMMPTAYLLEALVVSTFEELTEQADRPHGEWIVEPFRNNWEFKCSVCGWNEQHAYIDAQRHNYCPNCGAKMGGDGE